MFESLKKIPFFPTRHRIQMGLAVIREKTKGLDFSRPDRMYDRAKKGYNMYVISPDEILHNLLSCVDLKQFHSFIDVGCGKGYVMHKALEYGFTKVGGIEYDEQLYKICEENIRKTKRQDTISVTCGDACEFKHYGDYDVFYFFNPFKGEIMSKVMDQVVEQCRGREIMIIYYNPLYAEVMESYGYFTKIKQIHDRSKDYEAYVYRGVIPAAGEKEQQ